MHEISGAQHAATPLRRSLGPGVRSAELSPAPFAPARCGPSASALQKRANTGSVCPVVARSRAVACRAQPQSFSPQLDPSDKIEGFGFVNVEPAGMGQRGERGGNIALLRFQFSESEESRILPPVIVGEFLNHRQSGFRSAGAAKNFGLKRRQGPNVWLELARGVEEAQGFAIAMLLDLTVSKLKHRRPGAWIFFPLRGRCGGRRRH